MAHIETGRVGRRRNLEEFIAYLPNVQRAVDGKAAIIARRAEASLAYHRDTGNAQIEVVKGDIDAYVVLVDPAAMSIEMGRAHDHLNADGEEVGGMEGLHILAYATYFKTRRRR